MFSKEIKIPHNKTMQVMLKHKYMATLYHTIFDFQGQITIFVDLKYSSVYTIVEEFEASRRVVNIKNVDCNVPCFSPGQIILYLDYRPKGAHSHSVISVKTSHQYKSTFLCHIGCCMIHYLWNHYTPHLLMKQMHNYISQQDYTPILQILISQIILRLRLFIFCSAH